MASRSLSYNGALQDLATLLHRIALAQSVPSAVPEDLPELADIGRLAGQFDPQEVQLYYQIAVNGRNEIGLAPDEYAGFTMTLLRMLAFRPGQGGAEAPAPAPAAARPAAPPARPAAAAAAAVASHSAVAPPARPAAPPAAPAAPAAAAPSGSAPAMSSARAAINAALEAARAASRSSSGGGGRRPAAPAPQAEPPAAAAPAAPAPAAPPAPSAQLTSAAPPAPSAQPAPAPAAPSAAPPWDQGHPNAAARQQPQALRSGYDEQAGNDEPPSWVTEFSDDTAVASEAPAAVAPPVAARAPARAPHPYVVTPVPQIGWDGNWPALAATLQLRGVSQQLALQTELIDCTAQPGAVTFRLRVPVDTLRVSGNSEKLTAALQERFPAVRVNLETEIGPVWYTASAEAKAHREQLQREAEATVEADPWVRQMAGTLDAFVVPGSVRPIAT
jgi:DNA polymerase-3 subunit gamma/tau